MKILAVDDIADNLMLIEHIFLKDDRIEVLKAENGEVALEVLKKHSDIKLILLDIAMPVMNGFVTLGYLTSDEEWKKIPTIVVTADTDERSRAFKCGATLFVSKPVDVIELMAQVYSFLGIAPLPVTEQE